MNKLDNAIPKSTSVLVNNIGKCKVCSVETDKKCGRCKKVLYCKRECQVKDWKDHKIECIPTQPNPDKCEDEKLQGKGNSDFISQVKAVTSSFKLEEDEEVYVTTNEEGQIEALKSLSEIQSQGDVFIGTSGLSCLNLVSVRPGVKFVIIIDRSSLVPSFWKAIAPLITESENLEDCRKKILAFIQKRIREYASQDASSEAIVRMRDKYLADLVSKESWLMNAEKYNRIKQIFSQGQFACLHLDFSDETACKKLGDIFEKSNLKVDTLYISNIPDFILPNRMEFFGNALLSLLSENSIIVDSTQKDTRFKMTEKLSEHCLNYSVHSVANMRAMLLKSPVAPPIQRVRQRNKEPIFILYPFLKTLKTCKDLNKFYYFYGLEQGYYTGIEAQELSKKTDANLRIMKNSKDYPPHIAYMYAMMRG